MLEMLPHLKITNTDLTSLLLRSILGSKVSRGYVIILTRAEMPLSGVSPVVNDPTVVVLDVLDNLSLVVDVARCRNDHLQHHHQYLILTLLCSRLTLPWLFAREYVLFSKYIQTDGYLYDLELVKLTSKLSSKSL